MKIDKVEIKAFGKFKDRIIVFKDGINVVYGENESGKTTLQSFIKSMLYGIKGSNKTRLNSNQNMKRYKPWMDAGFLGAMEYSLDNGDQFRVERNFESNSTRVYDSFFNDITNTFEIDKNKNILFAKRHIGLNEYCFDKTIFVGQTGSFIDETGKSELKSMLINLSQTGFEDMSFIKAEKALKEAIKKYVGTDKSSIRPLDRINLRISELESLQNKLHKKREDLNNTEQDLRNAYNYYEKLIGAQHALDAAKLRLKSRMELQRSKLKENQLKELLDKIKELKKEQISIEDKLRELDDDCIMYPKLMEISSYELEEILKDYKLFLDLKEEITNLNEKRDIKKAEIIEAEDSLQQLSSFKFLGNKIDEEMLELNNKVDNIRKQINNISNEINDGNKVKNDYDKVAGKINLGGYNAGIIICLTLTALFSAGFLINRALLVGTPVFATMSLILYKIKRDKARINLNEQEAYERTSTSILKKHEEILEDEQKEIEDKIDSILVTVKAGSTEEFFRLNALYKSRVSLYNDLINDINVLEGKSVSSEKSLMILRNNILEKLFVLGIIDGQDADSDIKEAHIDIIRKSLNKRIAIKTNLDYMLGRKTDISKEIAACENKVEEIAELHKIASDEDLYRALNVLSQEIKIAEEALNSGKNKFHDSQINIQAEGINIIENSGNNEEQLEKLIQQNSFDVQDTLLKIKELETVLKNSVNDDELQKVSEELSELENKKLELEDLGFCLKTALETLIEASMEIHKDFAPALNERTSYYLSKMTAHRYGKLKLDESLSVRLITPETGGVESAELLSMGTGEQIYLALRIAASELMMSSGETLPLMLDEVFSFYDNQRTINTIKLLKELASNRQIIFFTCKVNELELVNEIFEDRINVIHL
ncbi:MAG: AAA family ATPase [Bacillota bacterium]|nr:AAA family ATPase [Bacillota bacterium]